MTKLDALKTALAEMESVLVAYSGGVDSTFLLRVARDVLGDKAVAVTALSESYPKAELDAAKTYAREMGARQILVDTKEIDEEQYRKNAPDRCFFCKDELFTKLAPIADLIGSRRSAPGPAALCQLLI